MDVVLLEIWWKPALLLQYSLFIIFAFDYIVASLWLSGEESACTAGSMGDVSSIPGSGGSLGEGNGNSLQYSCL